jgi:hypothetical protein
VAQITVTPLFPLETLATLIRRIGRKPTLGMCDYESPETRHGAGDSISCQQKATVHDLDTDLEYCARHFGEVSCG